MRSACFSFTPKSFLKYPSLHEQEAAFVTFARSKNQRSAAQESRCVPTESASCLIIHSRQYSYVPVKQGLFHVVESCRVARFDCGECWAPVFSSVNKAHCVGWGNSQFYKARSCHNAQACNVPQYSQLALRLLYGKRWAETDGASAALGELGRISLSAAD